MLPGPTRRIRTDRKGGRQCQDSSLHSIDDCPSWRERRAVKAVRAAEALTARRSRRTQQHRLNGAGCPPTSLSRDSADEPKKLAMGTVLGGFVLLQLVLAPAAMATPPRTSARLRTVDDQQKEVALAKDAGAYSGRCQGYRRRRARRVCHADPHRARQA